MAKYRPLRKDDLVIGEDFLCIVDECKDPRGSWAADLLTLDEVDIDGDPTFRSRDGYVTGFASLDTFNGLTHYYSECSDGSDRFVMVSLSLLKDESDFLGILQADYRDISESLAKQWREHVQG